MLFVAATNIGNHQALTLPFIRAVFNLLQALGTGAPIRYAFKIMGPYVYDMTEDYFINKK